MIAFGENTRAIGKNMQRGKPVLIPEGGSPGKQSVRTPTPGRVGIVEKTGRPVMGRIGVHRKTHALNRNRDNFHVLGC